jgi:DNA-binding GntR family transcriptional regulator
MPALFYGCQLAIGRSYFDHPRQGLLATMKRIRKRKSPRTTKRIRKQKFASAAQHSTRPEWLAGILRERILHGRYRPGDRIREHELHREFGFSNGPIREALQLLASEGLLDRSPWQGVRVIELTKEEIIELFQVRAALFEYAVELAATNRSAIALVDAPLVKGELKETYAKTRTGAKPHITSRFMDWIFHVAGNKTLESLWNKATAQSRVYVYASMRKSAGSERPAYGLIDAIIGGDVSRARRHARRITSLHLFELLGERL